MNKKSILSGGASIVGRNKRYVVWFWLMNLALATIGSEAFSLRAHHILDQSLYSDRLVHGMDLGVFGEMLGRPEFGPLRGAALPSMMLALLFFVLTMIFLPGVLQGYASDHRISRGEFWRACGVNVWRFLRLTILSMIVIAIVAGVFSAIGNALGKAADATSNERLPFFVQLGWLAAMFLAMTIVRIWFDLAETDAVLSDQPAVRKSLRYAVHHTRHNLVRLLGSYVLIALVGAAVVAGGVVLWNLIVPPASVLGAYIIAQAIAFFFLATRFWQRAVAVSFYKSNALEDIVEFAPMIVAAAPVAADPAQL
ncbi:MAG TPA: hypothetical protein VF753_18720 [Terriglobales bacterium]